MRIGYLECFSGISGDMLLGALVDAGVPFDCLQQAAAALNIDARLEMRKVSRGGLAAIKVDVLAPDQPVTDAGPSHHGHALHSHDAHALPAHRSLSAILNIIRSASISEAVKDRSGRAFQLLGEAEAAIHSLPTQNEQFPKAGDPTPLNYII